VAAYTYTFKAFDGALSSGSLLHITSSASTSATLGGTVFATQSAQSTLSGAVRVTNASSITFGGEIISAKQLNFRAFDSAGLSTTTQHRIIDSGHFVQTSIGGSIYSSAIQLNFKAFDQSGLSTSSSLTLSTGSRVTEHVHVGGEITVGHFVNIDAGGAVLAPVEASSVAGGLIRDRSQINLRFEDGISPSTFITYFTNLIPRAASFVVNGTISGIQSLLVSMGGDIRRNKALNLRFEDGISPSVLRTYYVDEVIRAASVTMQGNVVNPVAQTFTGSIVCAETVQGDLSTQKTFSSIISDADTDSSALSTLIYLTGSFSSVDSLQGAPSTQKPLPAKVWPSQSSIVDLMSGTAMGFGWVFPDGASATVWGRGPYENIAVEIWRPLNYPGRIQNHDFLTQSVATGTIWTHSVYVSGNMPALHDAYFTTHPSRSSVDISHFVNAADGVKFSTFNSATALSVLPSATLNVLASGVLMYPNGWKRVWYTTTSPYGRADSFVWNYWDNGTATAGQFKGSSWGLKDEIGYLTEPYLPNELSASLFTEKPLQATITDSDSIVGDIVAFRGIESQITSIDSLDATDLQTSIRFNAELNSTSEMYGDFTANYGLWGDVADSDSLSGSLFKGSGANSLDSKNKTANYSTQNTNGNVAVAFASATFNGASVEGPFPGTTAKRYGWIASTGTLLGMFTFQTTRTGSMTSVSSSVWTRSFYLRVTASSVIMINEAGTLYGPGYGFVGPNGYFFPVPPDTTIAHGSYPVGNGYYRMWLTYRPTITDTTLGMEFAFASSPGGLNTHVYDIYGMQFEPGYLTEYVPLFEGLSGSFDTSLPLSSIVTEVDSTSGDLSTIKTLDSQISDFDLAIGQMGAPQQIDFDGQMSDSDTGTVGDLSTAIFLAAEAQESDLIQPAVFRTAALMDGHVVDIDELIGHVQIQASFDGELIDIDTTSTTDLSTGIRLAQTMSDSYTLFGQLESSIVMEGMDSSNSAMVGSLTIDRRRPPKHHRVRGILRRTLARWWAIYDDEY
jgi:hypothetical protein